MTAYDEDSMSSATSNIDTAEIVRLLRENSAETSQIEVKSAAKGLPKSLRPTVSAFCNDSGGTVLLGLSDPAEGLLPVDGFKPENMRDAMTDLMAHHIEPAATGSVEIIPLENGYRIVRADIAEGEPHLKPYYVKDAGRYNGSYTRRGDGEYKLRDYEIDRILENRPQPTYDEELVPGTSFEDLSPRLVERYVNYLREIQPRVFANASAEDALKKTRVLRKDADGQYVLTLAGLLTLGDYPQAFFPQLAVSVVVLPTGRMGEQVDGVRFLDNEFCTGAIPDMIDDATAVIIKNMRKGAVMDGPTGHRRESLEYPLEVVRELLVNALMHRDYSPGARGAQVQVEMYPDRLMVRSPGGIYGPVNLADFGELGVSSSRNSALAGILMDLPVPSTGHRVAENRGSGIPTIFNSLHSAGLEKPRFVDSPRMVEATVYNTPREESLDAPREIAGPDVPIVPETPSMPVSRASQGRNELILSLLRGHELSILELLEGLEKQGVRVARPTLTKDLNELVSRGSVEATAPPRSKNRTYRIPR